MSAFLPHPPDAFDEQAGPLYAVADRLDDPHVMQRMLCPVCWALISVWLASPDGTAGCIICGNRFPVAQSDA